MFRFRLSTLLGMIFLIGLGRFWFGDGASVRHPLFYSDRDLNEHPFLRISVVSDAEAAGVLGMLHNYADTRQNVDPIDFQTHDAIFWPVSRSAPVPQMSARLDGWLVSLKSHCAAINQPDMWAIYAIPKRARIVDLAPSRTMFALDAAAGGLIVSAAMIVWLSLRIVSHMQRERQCAGMRAGTSASGT